MHRRCISDDTSLDSDHAFIKEVPGAVTTTGYDSRCITSLNNRSGLAFSYYYWTPNILAWHAMKFLEPTS
jgi:hypothetical protein